MKKMSTLSILFLAICGFCLVLMRSCGGAEPPVPTYTPAPVTVQPTDPPMTETPTPVVQHTPEPVEKALWTTDGVNLRRGPDTASEKMAVIAEGEELLRIELPAGNWVKVRYNELEGYVSCDYVSETDPGSAEPSAAPTTTATTAPAEFVVTPCSDVVYTTDGVNLRRGPGTDYDVAISVNKDTRLERTGTTDNGWSRVLFESVGYFVSSEFVTTTAPAQTEDAGAGSAPDTLITSNSTSVASSGEFRSETGVPLNVVVRWSTAPNTDGTYNLTLSASLVSRTLTAAQYADNLCFAIGENTFYKTAPAIDIPGADEVETPLGSQSTTVNPGSVPVSVSWAFKGTYAQQTIDKVTASAVIYVGGTAPA